MRAHFIRSLNIEENYVLSEPSVHHLVNVVRIQKGEEVLLLNGRGLKVKALVEYVSRKEVRLKRISSTQEERTYHFDLALGVPKKEALELCLRESTELGFESIYLVESEFSQLKNLDQERLEKILISALEQCNAGFLPKVILAKWDDVPWGNYADLILLDSRKDERPQNLKLSPEKKKLLIVGPEGGFSLNELKNLYSKEFIRGVNLPTPILRTPTAVAVGGGIMIESLLN